MNKNKERILIILLVIFVVLTLSLSTYVGYSYLNKAVSSDNETSSTTETINKYVTINKFNIENAKVVNAVDNNMTVTGTIDYKINDSRFLDVSFEGVCYDTNGNDYNVNVFATCGSWVPFSSIGDGIQTFCGNEDYSENYGEKYNLYINNSDSGYKSWKKVEFKSCRFYKMKTVLMDNGKEYTIEEEVEYSKEF